MIRMEGLNQGGTLRSFDSLSKGYQGIYTVLQNVKVVVVLILGGGFPTNNFSCNRSDPNMSIDSCSQGTWSQEKRTLLVSINCTNIYS